MQIPRAQQVDMALKGVERAAKSSLQALNEKAGNLMKHGKYTDASAFAATGREIQDFISAVRELSDRWRSLKTAGGKSKAARSPLWVYYQPILAALVELGGTARRAELEPLVERAMANALELGDGAVLAGGRKRWQAMVARARKALVAEGWLEPTKGDPWRITDAGRKAALAKHRTPGTR